MDMRTIDERQATVEFTKGKRLGECLVRGCAVFIGAIQSLGALQNEAGVADGERAMKTREVNLKVTAWLFGEGQEETFRLLYFGQPEMSKTSLGPWLAWEGASLHVGGQLLVVRWAGNASRATWNGGPEDVALVVSDANLFTPIRDVIAQHQRFERDPAEAANAPELLRQKHDGLFTGYVLTYLIERAAVRDVDSAAGTLSRLLGLPSLSGEGRQRVANALVGDFYRLQDPTRRSVAHALISLASNENRQVAYPAVGALARLCDEELINLKPLLNHDHQQKIAENYRALQSQSKTGEKHPTFESQLGLK